MTVRPEGLGPLRGDSVAFISHEYSSNKQHILYVIRVEWGGGEPWKVRKRYSDFEALHKSLLSVYGKQQVPEMPRKKRIPVGGMASGFVDKRMIKLQMYLRNVIDQCGIWFKMNDEHPMIGQGPGAMLGINDFLFEFLEFSSNAIISKPQTAIEGDGVTVLPGTETIDFTHASQIRVLPMMTGTDLAALQAKLSQVPLIHDDLRPATLKSELENRKSKGQTIYINSLQATSLVKEAFLSSNRLAIALELAPLVQDPQNYHQIAELIDFDAQIEKLSKTFSDYIKKRHRESMNISMADMADPPVPRKRGITVTPIEE
eukprot:TRINITY_DN14544_c0_g1_i1.p1 TRINITY_DN14544_c0_g1~~TRINITY_DN14544_c0_g1_i1.p1  ORF type:complete len:330 (+),score=80.24 TRINITY_DN14544_c0_g1_i1:45-992(+)